MTHKTQSLIIKMDSKPTKHRDSSAETNINQWWYSTTKELLQSYLTGQHVRDLQMRH